MECPYLGCTLPLKKLMINYNGQLYHSGMTTLMALQSCSKGFAPHDFNCETYVYICDTGHRTKLGIIHSCPCGWKLTGKCFCHALEKLEALPEAEELVP